MEQFSVRCRDQQHQQHLALLGKQVLRPQRRPAQWQTQRVEPSSAFGEPSRGL